MGSTPRPSPSGGSGPRLRTGKLGRGRSPPFFPLNRKPLLLPFADIRCCRSTIASTLFRPPSRSCPAPRCTDVCSGTRSPGCPMSTATGPGAGSSSRIRSAISTSISPRCAPSRASFTSSSQSTGPRSSPSSRSMRRPPNGLRPTSIRCSNGAVEPLLSIFQVI